MSTRRRPKTTSCQDGVVLRRHRVKTALCQRGVAPKQHGHKAIPRRDGVVSNTTSSQDDAGVKKNDVVATLCRVNGTQCQDDAMPNIVVSARLRVKTVSCQKRHRIKMVWCQHDVVSTGRCVSTVSCQNEVVSTRHRIKKTPCQDGIVSM